MYYLNRRYSARYNSVVGISNWFLIINIHYKHSMPWTLYFLHDKTNKLLLTGEDIAELFSETTRIYLDSSSKRQLIQVMCFWLFSTNKNLLYYFYGFRFVSWWWMIGGRCPLISVGNSSEVHTTNASTNRTGYRCQEIGQHLLTYLHLSVIC